MISVTMAKIKQLLIYFIDDLNMAYVDTYDTQCTALCLSFFCGSANIRHQLFEDSARLNEINIKMQKFNKRIKFNFKRKVKCKWTIILIIFTD